MKTLLRAATLGVLSGWAVAVQALSIDTMVLVSGQQTGGDSFTLTNNSEEPVFVRTELARIDVQDQKSRETPLTRDNLAEWTMTLDPALFILDPGESRKVNLRPLTDAAARSRDDVYAVSFVPQPHKTVPGDRDSMSLQVGFRAYYIVPAGTSQMNYQLDYDRATGKLTLDNRGNTALFAVLNQCANGVKDEADKPCSTTFMAVAGLSKTFDVPQWLRTDKMVFEVQNHDKSVSKREEK
ncbi:TPA: molecular chaperone [Aeromonas sobria]|nr:molecular chaperone [Aeromonas sobria]